MIGVECTIEFSSRYAFDDDSVGGPEITGTVVNSLQGRIETVPVEMLLLNQGLETGQLYMCTAVSADAIVLNNFSARVTSPPSHFLYNIPLKVLQVTRTSGFGPFGHFEILLRHVYESH